MSSNISIWIEFFCQHCEARNFVNNGDPADMTVVDDNAATCWKCGKVTVFGDDEVDEIDEDDLYVGSGVHMEEVVQDRQTTPPT